MKDVTFCLMTCGELTEKDCLKAIEPFKEKIVLQEVRNVYPQITALNKMLEQVETPYLVPLDADMILNSDAYDRIRFVIDKHSHDPHWHSILFKLYDTLTEREILALKVLRTEVMKKYMFRESATPDVEHFKRLTDNGYTCINKYLQKSTIGKHVVKGKHFCYHKYRDVYMTLKSHGWEWDKGAFMGGETILQKSVHHFNYFMYKWAVTNDDDYIWCVAGMLDGLLTEPDHKSKDLKKKPLRFNLKEAIHGFYSWWLMPEIIKAKEVMLF